MVSLRYRKFHQGVRQYFRNTWPRLHHLQIRVRGLPLLQKVSAFRNYARIRLAALRGQTQLPIEISGEAGFGGLLTQVLMALHYCESHGWIPLIKVSSPTYASDLSRPEDWFTTYFESVKSEGQEGQQATVVHDSKSYLPIRSQFSLALAGYEIEPASIAAANALFLKHFRIRGNWLIDADATLTTEAGHRTLGVHYRGTDKWIEAQPAEWATVRAQVDQQLDSGRFTHVFVATDEPDFLDYMVNIYGRAKILDLDCKEIYSGQATHFASGNRAQKGREAMLTIIILSRCRLLIRTASHLSAWAKILNPYLEVKMVNKPLPGSFHFPETAIWKEFQSVAARSGDV